MIKHIICLSFSLLFGISVSCYANDWGGKNGSNSGNNVLNGASLAGSKQGQSVGFADIDGDGIDDKIVGAPYASSSSNTGALLVYTGYAYGGYSPTPYMILAGDDNYGFSFADLGDVDADGKNDFAVAAIHGNGMDVSLSGSVTVYKGGRPWNYNEGLGKTIAKLAGEGPLDKFGISIAAGDLNGDGLKDLVVGAPFNTNDPALYQGGAVYVYFAPNFTNKAALHASTINKGLGWSSSTGDINGDAIEDLCISASGKVICYYGSRSFSPLIDAPEVTIKSSSSGFGKALALTGDLDDDGFGEIVVGAPNAVINGNRDTGSIFIVKGGSGIRAINVDNPSSDLIVRINGNALFDRFGFSIVAVNDNDSSQKTDLAIGAPTVSDMHMLSGKVYFFKGKDINSITTLLNATVFEGNTVNQGYGTSLSATPDRRLLIGAPRTDMDTGAVYMVDLNTGQPVPGGSSGGSSGSGDECP
jgi:hypothetical protein